MAMWPTRRRSDASSYTCATRPCPLCVRMVAPSLTLIPVLSCPRCCSVHRPVCTRRATSAPSRPGTYTPKTPHFSCMRHPARHGVTRLALRPMIAPHRRDGHDEICHRECVRADGYAAVTGPLRRLGEARISHSADVARGSTGARLLGEERHYSTAGDLNDFDTSGARHAGRTIR